jgi:Na+/H+ antiporter NhaA
MKYIFHLIQIELNFITLNGIQIQLIQLDLDSIELTRNVHMQINAQSMENFFFIVTMMLKKIQFQKGTFPFHSKQILDPILFL